MSESIKDTINKTIKENKVVLYMKGTPESPMCGFSAKVIQILNQVGAIYITFDVLSDPNLRQGIKDFSQWPTIPQLYVKNEFVGGCDIIREMHENGELTEYFSQAGINTEL